MLYDYLTFFIAVLQMALRSMTSGYLRIRNLFKFLYSCGPWNIHQQPSVYTLNKMLSSHRHTEVLKSDIMESNKIVLVTEKPSICKAIYKA